jgi:phosphate transport system substrate-binding protein
MKSLVWLVALMSIIGSGLLFLHKPGARFGNSHNTTGATGGTRTTGGTTGATGTPVVEPPPPAERPDTSSLPGSSKNGVVNVYGTAEVFPVIHAVRSEFEAREGSPKVETRPMSIDDAKRKIESSSTFDFALINREQSDDEKHLKASPVAYRGLCIVVNAANPVTSLTAAQITAIYLGTSTKWTEVGGSDAGIALYQFASKESPIKPFNDYFKLAPDKVVPAVGQSDSATEIVKKVGLDAGGIAVVPYVVVSSQQDRDNMKVKLVAINGVDPTAASIRDGTYPLAMPIILLTRGEPEDGPARDFLRYVNSDAVQGKDGVLRKNLLLLSGR